MVFAPVVDRARGVLDRVGVGRLRQAVQLRQHTRLAAGHLGEGGVIRQVVQAGDGIEEDGLGVLRDEERVEEHLHRCEHREREKSVSTE